jgi:hypothetical protein
VVDVDGRKTVPLFMAATSIVCMWFLSYLFTMWSISLPWWVEGPSIVGLYGLFYSFFNERVWRLSLIQRMLKIPDLRGMWRGYIQSSYDNFESKIDAKMEIRQNWTRMLVTMQTQMSKGYSLGAMIITHGSDEMVLSFEYFNEPKPTATSAMHMHGGTTRLTIAPDFRSLDGDYYTGRDRRNYGILHFERVK